ncbi:MAG: CxxxxCH/CxxCH domain-containing protein [Deltaproteobacteria bacterium]|nr:CxxxxCH/CxxCH domain-containing protein [Deltaproteobacteria bacterium]
MGVTHMRARLFGGLLGLLVLVGVGCGGDDDETDASRDGSTSTLEDANGGIDGAMDASLISDAGLAVDGGSSVDAASADAASADASGADASGADASGADASGADASGADASGADASGADASGTDAAAGDSGLDPVASCTGCHGEATRDPTQANPFLAAAPPRGSKGETTTDARAVGAHQSHLQPGALAHAIPCDACHVIPTDLTHIDGTAAINFGGLATSDGVSPIWDGSACANAYCHGATLEGGMVSTPEWTVVDGSQARCEACHGLAPSTGRHTRHVVEESLSCTECHGSGYEVTGASSGTVNVATHIDGQVDVGGAGAQVTLYGSGSCANNCHRTRPW